ncbi:PHP domain-containing protein [candidate division KSB1 bacterium]|nr:PHP domain-containing protein [candidate division KSB1 bacterium]
MQDSLIDLHIHSSFSDGLWTPAKVVETAHIMGLRAIAITDHDDVRNLPQTLQAGRKYGVEIVPGIEISAAQHTTETHILGYYINPENEALLHFTRQFRVHREHRARQILSRLDDLGIHIPFEVLKMKAGEGSLGRPHIADILVEEGVVFSFYEAFQKFLGDNKPAYVPKQCMSAQEAIELIHQAEGLAFLAHPGVGVDEDIIYQLIELGLDGLETLHPRHLTMMIERYQEIVYKHDLLQTGGSDCHGGRRGEIMLGSIKVPADFLDQMQARYAQTRISRLA